MAVDAAAAAADAVTKEEKDGRTKREKEKIKE